MANNGSGVLNVPVECFRIQPMNTQDLLKARRVPPLPPMARLAPVLFLLLATTCSDCLARSWLPVHLKLTFHYVFILNLIMSFIFWLVSWPEPLLSCGVQKVPGLLVRRKADDRSRDSLLHCPLVLWCFL